MRAVAVPKLRDPPRSMEVPAPTERPGEVQVRLSFAGVNPFDWKIADGALSPSRPHTFPLVLGVDGAGTVSAVGAEVRRFRVGDAVFGSFLHDPVGIGTYAELSTAPETNALAAIPEGLRPADAAALPTAGMTALTTIDALGLREGHTLVIVGASGGVGSYAVQIAAQARVRVIAVARPDAHTKLRALGAAEVVDPTRPDLAGRLRGALGGPADGLADLMSDRAAFASIASLVRPGGTAASTVGGADEASLATAHVRGVNIDMHPSVGLLDRLARMVVDGHVRVPIEAERPLEEAPAVIADVRAGRGRGKTVLRI